MRKPESTPTVERELRALDDALASGEPTATDPVERELQDLALLLRADRPQADPTFARPLTARVRAGFPRGPRSRRGRARRAVVALRGMAGGLRQRATLPVLGGAAALLVAIAVAVSLQDGGGGQDGSAQLATDDSLRGRTTELRGAAPSDRVRDAATPQELVEDLPPVSRQDFKPGRDRRIERSAALTLAAPGDELGRVADGVTAATERHGGFVLRSSVTSGDDGGESGGNFDLRIPVDRLQPALRDLARLGDVRSRTQTGQDVTREYVSVRERLQVARAERRSLLRRLENADTDGQVEAIRRRLDLVASQIRGLRSQLKDLRIRTDYVAVSVSLVEDGGGHDEGGASGTDEALDDFLGSLSGSLNLALRALGVLIPLGLATLAAWLAWRTGRRRRRESVLA